MPIVDLPLAQLKTYQGTNKRPKDFHSFWENRKKEALATPLSYHLTSVLETKHVHFKELTFKGINGEWRVAKVVIPVSEKKVPLVLQFHGYPGSSRSFFELSNFAAANMAVVALDCPGQGGKGVDVGGYAGPTVSGHLIAGLEGDPKDLYYVRLFQDIIILCQLVQTLECIDADRIYANGASQGAALALVCTALNECVKKCVALYPFLSDYERVWDMDLDAIAYEGLRYYSKWFDIEGKRHAHFFETLGYIDVQHFASAISVPVLAGTGLMDTICPPSTQFAVFNKLKGPKQHLIYPDYTHEEIGAFDDLILDFLLKDGDDCAHA